MPVIKWAFLCDYASVDAAGKAYIIGTFEYINLPSLPRRWPQIYVALEIQTTSAENFELSAQITAPSGKETSKKIVIPFKSWALDDQTRKGFATFAFFNTIFSEEGEYHIELFLDDTCVHFIPLNIRVKPAYKNQSSPDSNKPDP